MMYHSKSQIGFSLVELMVVLAIMGAVMGLTGGLVTNVVAKQERFVELERIKQLVIQHQYIAFYEGTQIDFQFKESSLVIRKRNTESKLEFKHLVFVANTSRILTTGWLVNDKYSTFSGDDILEHRIPRVFNEIE